MEATRKSNRYAGTCSQCGEKVAAQQGRMTVNDAGKWTVTHRNCKVQTQPERKTPVGYREAERDAAERFINQAKTKALPRRRPDESGGEFAYRILADQSLAEIGEVR